MNIDTKGIVYDTEMEDSHDAVLVLAVRKRERAPWEFADFMTHTIELFTRCLSIPSEKQLYIRYNFYSYTIVNHIFMQRQGILRYYIHSYIYETTAIVMFS
jgi:hypothetical protein